MSNPKVLKSDSEEYKCEECPTDDVELQTRIIKVNKSRYIHVKNYKNCFCGKNDTKTIVSPTLSGLMKKIKAAT